MAGDEVHIGIQDAIQTAELLEQLTVSLDRIGSRDADGEDGANLLWAFVVDGDVFRRCSAMRLPLWAAIDEVRGVGTSEFLADAVATFPEVGGRSSV
jgi:hypothetical protein